jgi:hypothetical protein
MKIAVLDKLQDTRVISVLKRKSRAPMTKLY